MSSNPKVSATGTAGAVSVPTRVATGTRASVMDRIEGVSGAAAVGFSGNWHPSNDDAAPQGGFEGYRQGRGQAQPQFTPLVGSRAAAFPASQHYSGNVLPASLFGSDLRRAVGIYAFNMDLLTGNYATQGSVINHMS